MVTFKPCFFFSFFLFFLRGKGRGKKPRKEKHTNSKIYLEESELLVICSVFLFSCSSLLTLPNTDLSRAFPFLKPPCIAAFAWITYQPKQNILEQVSQLTQLGLGNYSRAGTISKIWNKSGNKKTRLESSGKHKKK